MDHLGETARTLLTSGQRGDQDSDNFVALLPAEPAGPDAAAPGDREPALLAGDRAGERCAARSDVDGLTLYDDIVTSAITRNSFGHAGATDKTAQANHLVITDVASREIDSGVQPEGGCGCCPIDLAPDANRYGTCGNAVSVPVITWIGHRFWDELIAQRVAETEEWDGS